MTSGFGQVQADSSCDITLEDCAHGDGHARSNRLIEREPTYIDFHVLIERVIHDKTMSQPNSMRLHWMSSNIGIIAYIGVVKVGNAFLVMAIRGRRIQGGKRRHDSIPSQRGSLLTIKFFNQVDI